MRLGRTNGIQRSLEGMKDTSTSNLEVNTVSRQKQLLLSKKSYLNPIKIVPSKIFDPLQSDNNFLKIASLHENPWNSRIRSSMVSGSVTTQQRTDELSAKLSARTTGTTGTGSECSSRSSARKAWRWESRWSERALVLHESEPLSAGRNLGLTRRYKPAPVGQIFTKLYLRPRSIWPERTLKMPNLTKPLAT